jgi:hypothetical protein
VDQIGSLERVGDDRHTVALHAEHLGEKFLRRMQRVVARKVPQAQQVS